MFEGKDLLYDTVIIFLATGIPTLLSFFYFRTTRHFQNEQMKRDEQIKQDKLNLATEIKTIASDTAREVASQNEKVHTTMMETFRKELSTSIKTVIEDLNKEQSTNKIVIDKLDQTFTRLNDILNKLVERVGKAERATNSMQKKIIKVQDETDDIIDRENPPTAKEKRERERERNKDKEEANGNSNDNGNDIIN